VNPVSSFRACARTEAARCTLRLKSAHKAVLGLARLAALEVGPRLLLQNERQRGAGGGRQPREVEHRVGAAEGVQHAHRSCKRGRRVRLVRHDPVGRQRAVPGQALQQPALGRRQRGGDGQR